MSQGNCFENPFENLIGNLNLNCQSKLIGGSEEQDEAKETTNQTEEKKTGMNEEEKASGAVEDAKLLVDTQERVYYNEVRKERTWPKTRRRNTVWKNH